jgi:hypothetical protein
MFETVYDDKVLVHVQMIVYITRLRRAVYVLATTRVPGSYLHGHCAEHYPLQWGGFGVPSLPAT